MPPRSIPRSPSQQAPPPGRLKRERGKRTRNGRSVRARTPCLARPPVPRRAQSARKPAARLPTPPAAPPAPPELRAAAAASGRRRPSPLGVGSAHSWGPGPAPRGPRRVPRVSPPRLESVRSWPRGAGRTPSGLSAPLRAPPLSALSPVTLLPFSSPLCGAPRAGRWPGGAGLSLGIPAALVTLARRWASRGALTGRVSAWV